MTTNRPTPVCLGMILADLVWVDHLTGKHSILGAFTVFAASQFPAANQPMSVYFLLTDGRGTISVSLRVVSSRDEEQEPLFAHTMDMTFRDPRAVTAGAFILPKISFPHEGEYRFQLRGGGELIMERRLSVVTRGGVANVKVE